MEPAVDFIIIGSGFGGSVSALRLAEKGYSVMVFEKGRRYSSEDFPRTNWNLRKYLWLPSLRFFGFQKLSFFKQASILSGVGVGGGSLVYANTLFFPSDDYFSKGPWASFQDWKKALLPFYQVASWMLGKVKYQQVNREDEVLKTVATKFGRDHTFENVEVGVYIGDREQLTDPYFNGFGPLRKGCIECAGCMVGCRENAKNSLDKNYLFFAEKFGATIYPERQVYKIEYLNNKYTVHTRSSTAFFNRKKLIHYSRNIIISGGTLGTLELLLKQKYYYHTLPGLSDTLGHELRTNSETLSAVSGVKEKMNNGLAITSVIHPDDNTHVEVVKYPDGSNSLKWFFSLSAEGTKNPSLRIFRLIQKTISHPVSFIRTVFNFHWSTGLIIFLVMQHLDNAMVMILKKGLFGPRLFIFNKTKKPVPAYINIGQQVMETYAREVNGIPQNIILEVLFNRATTAHILGGCPMSVSVESGVIDNQFRVHGYPGMYILDGSSLQANPGVNPSLSIMANAEYALSLIPIKEGHQYISLEKLILQKTSDSGQTLKN
jgi:cholesterol oxidase